MDYKKTKAQIREEISALPVLHAFMPFGSPAQQLAWINANKGRFDGLTDGQQNILAASRPYLKDDRIDALITRLKEKNQS